MIECYLLVICSGSSLDKHTNNFSLFNFVEELHIPAELLGKPAPFEVHFMWLASPDGRKTAYEIRLVRIAEDGTEDPGDHLPLEIGDTARHRVRVNAVKIPEKFGRYILKPEWRAKGEEAWTRSDAIWPLSVFETQPTPADPKSSDSPSPPAPK